MQTLLFTSQLPPGERAWLNQRVRTFINDSWKHAFTVASILLSNGRINEKTFAACAGAFARMRLDLLDYNIDTLEDLSYKMELAESFAKLSVSFIPYEHHYQAISFKTLLTAIDQNGINLEESDTPGQTRTSIPAGGDPAG